MSIKIIRHQTSQLVSIPTRFIAPGGTGAAFITNDMGMNKILINVRIRMAPEVGTDEKVFVLLKRSLEGDFYENITTLDGITIDATPSALYDFYLEDIYVMTPYLAVHVFNSTSAFLLYQVKTMGSWETIEDIMHYYHEPRGSLTLDSIDTHFAPVVGGRLRFMGDVMGGQYIFDGLGKLILSSNTGGGDDGNGPLVSYTDE